MLSLVYICVTVKTVDQHRNSVMSSEVVYLLLFTVPLLENHMALYFIYWAKAMTLH